MAEKDYEKLKQIEEAITSFSSKKLYESSLAFFNALDYSSNKTDRLKPATFEGFLESFNISKNTINKEKAIVTDWEQVEFIFQVSDSEITQVQSLFDTGNIDKNEYQSFLFFAIHLKENSYKRGELVKITRELNVPFKMPVIVLFHYGNKLTLSIIDRRLHKKDTRKDVLEKVTLIKDIDITTPQRAHKEILKDLSLNELYKKFEFHSFVKLHEAWKVTLNISELNKKFYREIFDWYLWASKVVKFPQIRPEEDVIANDIHQSESLIRLLTRLLFCWFMKEKGLINEELFNERDILQMLKGLKPDETTYYKAILQNLFFATLNQPIEKRKSIDPGWNKSEYGDPLVYRYQELFREPENILSHFQSIPFLNGGLFDCLDQKKDAKHHQEIRLDGFSTKKQKQPVVPNKLFFGEYTNIDLSTEYADKKKSKLKVRGIIDILSSYKFTIEENTPVEEEVALDPELLGKVFENLLASYIPETQSTARKQTGSFYTPREIVNFMVDESLITFLKSKIPEIETKEFALRKLFDYKYSGTELDFTKTEKEKLLTTLHQCRIIDPACGSGAFPMGILQKMIYVLRRLDPENILWLEMVVSNFPEYMQAQMREKLKGETWDYVRKIGIIKECIYGIDWQPIAIQISKLRFFISLLVDQNEKSDLPNRGFDPLPNLDFKLISANTVIAPPSNETVGTGLFANQKDPFHEQLKTLTAKYFSTYLSDEKRELRNQIEDLVNKEVAIKINSIEKQYVSENKLVEKALQEKYKDRIAAKENDIKLWKSYTRLFKHEAVGFFDIPFFYPQVKDGFDIVIGNPPFIQMQKNAGKLAKELQKFNYKTFEKTGDLYAIFYEKGINILKEGGIETFITSSQWMKASYGKSLRKFFLEKNPLKLVLLGPGAFESATVDTNILVIQNSENKKQLTGANVSDLQQLVEPKNLEFEAMPYVNEETWAISDLSKQLINSTIQKRGKALKDWNVKIYRGVLTGFNEAFIIDGSKRNELIKIDASSKEIIHPVLRGREIDKYFTEWDGGYLISTFPSLGITINNYKAVKKYLEGFLPKLNQTGETFINMEGKPEKTRKKTSHKWFELQDQIGYYKEFSKEKIVWKRIGSQLRFSYSDKEIYCLDSTCIATGEKIKFLTCLLNSKLCNYQLFENAPKTGMGDLIISVQALEALLVYYPNYKEEAIFNQLLKFILIQKYKGEDYFVFESVVNGCVYELYFGEEMEKAEIDILALVEKDLEVVKELSPEKAVTKLNKKWQEPKNEVRNRLMLMSTRCPDTIGVIEASVG